MLSRNSVLTEQQASRYLQRGEKDADRIVDALNGVAEQMRMFTRRRLVDTIYRQPVVIAGTTTKGLYTVAGTGYDTTVYAGDDIRGVNLPVGCRVQALTDSVLTLTRTAINTGAASMSVGTETERVDGLWQLNDNEPAIKLEEWPVTALYAVRQVFSDGTTQALDTRGYKIDPKIAGLVILPFAAIPSGRCTLEVDYRAGYRPPTATERGDERWYELERITRRMLQVNFRDDTQSRGRATDTSLGNRTSSTQNWELPLDIRQALGAFARVA